MIEAPTSTASPLTAGDLDRNTNTGRIYHLRRVTLMPAGCDDQGRLETRNWPGSGQPMAAEAATDAGIKPDGYSRMSPLVNVVFIVVIFSVLSALAIVKANKPALLLALCALLPLAAAGLVYAIARWRG